MAEQPEIQYITMVNRLRAQQGQGQLRVAIYAIGGKNSRSLGEARLICLEYGWHNPVEYVDAKIPSNGQPAMWQKLLVDIAAQQFDIVVTAHASQEFVEHCEKYQTQVANASL